MNDKIENPVLEQLRHIRGDIAKLTEEVREIKTTMLATRHQQRGMELTLDTHSDSLEGIKRRLERIERRLDLVDGPAE